MEKLIRGIHKFQSDVFQKREDFFHRLTRGQNPQALFITCSDSRVVPDLITQTDPGDLFVVRNAGNLIPPHVPGQSCGEVAAVEYAVRALGIRDIVVCGHTGCGAMQAVMTPGGADAMPRVRQWLGHADASWEIVMTQYGELSEEARWKVLTQENVLVQLEHLRTHPTVAAGLVAGEVRLHGWIYKIETGDVFAYDPDSGQFLPVVRPADNGPIPSTVPMSRRNGTARQSQPDPASL
jgi:carbonic anhydrase